MKKYLLIPVLCLFMTGQVFSQEKQDKVRESSNLPSRYLLGEDDNLLLPVNILGMVDKPGQYMVPYRTDLITLIAYAGGFRENAKITEIKLIRNLPTDGKNGANGKRGRPVVYKMNIKKYFENGDTSQIPQLLPDDTIVVAGTTTQTINKIFDFVAKGVMLAQIYFFIKVAND